MNKKHSGTQEEPMYKSERTFVAIKPDGVQRRFVGELLTRFENKGLHIVALKMLMANSLPLSDEARAALQKKKFLTSGPMVAMVLEGPNAVKAVWSLLGDQDGDPLKSAPGTVYGDFVMDKARDMVHASGTIEIAEQEIKQWFRAEEFVHYPTPHYITCQGEPCPATATQTTCPPASSQMACLPPLVEDTEALRQKCEDAAKARAEKYSNIDWPTPPVHHLI
jgi:nucleoside-diphosphate kinase